MEGHALHRKRIRGIVAVLVGLGPAALVVGGLDAPSASSTPPAASGAPEEAAAPFPAAPATGNVAHRADLLDLKRASRSAERAPLGVPSAPPPTLGPPAGPALPPPSAPVGEPRLIAQELLAQRGWSDEWGCLNNLWERESSWSVHEENASSGAYGIPQSLPADKMAVAGDDWRDNPRTQIRWGLDYIAQTYGGPCAAWTHSERFNWY